MYIDLNFVSEIPVSLRKVSYRMGYFPCSEFYFFLEDEVSGQNITIFQSFRIGNFHKDLFSLMRICNTLKANNAKKIVLFAPFIPYTRQEQSDRKNKSGFSFLIDIMENKCNIDEIITYDIHAKSSSKCFHSCFLTNMSMIPDFINDIDARNLNNGVIVFPDYGSQDRGLRFFKNQNSTVILKTRASNNSIHDMQIRDGSIIRNSTAVIIDDIIDSGDTIIKASDVLLQNGASAIHVYATHGLFSGDALQRLESSQIDTITISNSLRTEVYQFKKIRVLNISIPVKVGS